MHRIGSNLLPLGERNKTNLSVVMITEERSMEMKAAAASGSSSFAHRFIQTTKTWSRKKEEVCKQPARLLAGVRVHFSCANLVIIWSDTQPPPLFLNVQPRRSKCATFARFSPTYRSGCITRNAGVYPSLFLCVLPIVGAGKHHQQRKRETPFLLARKGEKKKHGDAEKGEKTPPPDAKAASRRVPEPRERKTTARTYLITSVGSFSSVLYHPLAHLTAFGTPCCKAYDVRLPHPWPTFE